MQDIKKIELHLHLDGSVRPETIADLSGLDIDYVRENMIASETSSLGEYLTKFDLPLKYMQTKENLTRIASELVEDLEKDNVVYAEVRFAPNKHREKNLTLEEIIFSVLQGLNRGNIKTKLILCMMRGDSFEDNFNILKLARMYNLPVDLAGDEARYSNEEYNDLFKYIKDNNMNFTIHSGEARGKGSIISALDFGAKRIGHGINIENDEELINRLKSEKILLEVCPTSNLNTKVISDIKLHPVYKYYKTGILISINTDNRTVSNTTLTKEYELLRENLGFTYNDFVKINKKAVEFAFIRDEEKLEILKKLEY